MRITAGRIQVVPADRTSGVHAVLAAHNYDLIFAFAVLPRGRWESCVVYAQPRIPMTVVAV